VSYTCIPCTFRSAPELGNNSKDGHLRKTNSQPQPSRGNPSLSHGNSVKARTEDDAHKHSRCKSVPTPLNEVANQNKVEGSGGAGPRPHDLSCPASPTGCSNNYSEDKKLTSASGSFSGEGGGDGTRPKKTIFEGFKNTLKKSKDGKLDGSYANSVEEEAEPVSQGSETPPSRAEGSERLDNEQNAVSGYPNALS